MTGDNDKGSVEEEVIEVIAQVADEPEPPIAGGTPFAVEAIQNLSGALSDAESAFSASAPHATTGKRKDVTATLRRTLAGELTDFLADEKFCVATIRAIGWLVVQLSRYQEEGVVLYPRFVICDDVPSLMKQVGGEDRTQIGSGPRTAETMKRALKKCAPLARDEWVAYVQRTELDGFAYGVFREQGQPVAVDLRDAIASGMVTPPREGGVVLISQVANRVVELVGARFRTLTYHLSGAEDNQPSPLRAIDELAAAMTALVPGASREATASFMRSTLGDALRRGHGTLIAIADPSKVPPELKDDSVSLDHASLDVATSVATHVAEGTASSLARVLAHAKLLEGMLATDGITVFQTDAKITRYNAFVKGPPQAAGALPRDMFGGARKRAFEVLKGLVDRGALVAAFFCSADGGSEFYPPRATNV